MKYNKKPPKTIILDAFFTSHHGIQLALASPMLCLYYEIASHTQISKHIFLFQNLLLVHVSLMYENATIAFHLIHSSHFLQKTHQAQAVIKLNMPIPKALHDFVKKNPNIWKSELLLHKWKRKRQQLGTWYGYEFQYFFSLTQFSLSKYKLSQYNIKVPLSQIFQVSCSLQSIYFGKWLKARQGKVADLCLKSLSQLYTVRAQYKHTMLTRCSIS